MDQTENMTHTWLKESWDFYLDNFGRILPALVAFQVLAALPALLIWKHFDNRWYALPYETLIAAPLSIGMNLFFINLSRGRPADYGDLFRGFSMFAKAIAVSFMYGLIVTAGFLLFIIPGVIWGVKYCFSQYAVIDRRTGIRESFVYSDLATYGFKDSLVLIFMLLTLVELFAPGVIGATGGLLHPVLALELKPWAVTVSLLKTFVFLPWLEIAMARSYVWLVKNREAGKEDAETT